MRQCIFVRPWLNSCLHGWITIKEDFLFFFIIVCNAHWKAQVSFLHTKFNKVYYAFWSFVVDVLLKKQAEPHWTIFVAMPWVNAKTHTCFIKHVNHFLYAQQAFFARPYCDKLEKICSFLEEIYKEKWDISLCHCFRWHCCRGCLLPSIAKHKNLGAKSGRK